MGYPSLTRLLVARYRHRSRRRVCSINRVASFMFGDSIGFVNSYFYIVQMHLSVSYFEISQFQKLHEHKNHLQFDLKLFEVSYKILIKLVFGIAISYLCTVNQLINNYESKKKACR
ncbi:hypothetical protein SPHINGO8BC_20003 [Sphingobacterium multivorum]|uniref:Uncharacterized protein n=1 Tax=Sphingobacterium multivorum TaxID=28454 RepID=A0A654B7I3_SPHMU|nr:hypothetical protein SPHINGO8BC_20003 [Sphingobacterium multivorum]